MHIIFLLTGSNIGDSELNLLNASKFIHQQIGKVVAASHVYKTEPWGNKDQQVFLNQVLKIETELDPKHLLKTILEIENAMGRNRKIKWEPRIIDIDILFYDDEIMDEENLQIPHPLLHERRFTLVPLNEIASSFIHPKLNKSINHLLEICEDNGIVEKL
jgi:2-amino-4-hydroxy-6-hydroxymethyldihydropteridine diphosphokinase